MITYGDVARRIEALASAWRHHPQHRVEPGEFVALIAFASTQMALADMACAYAQAIAVPLQANLPPADMAGILANTGPAALVANIENLEVATRHAIAQDTVRSLILIDSDAAVDEDRERIAAAQAALDEAGGRVALVTLDALIDYGAAFPWTPLPRHPDGSDALVLLMHTSGSTGTPKGAMIHEAMCNGLWNGLPMARPTIHVVCAPLNHFMGRSMVFGALAQGGKACFTLNSDMSSLFEDIRIVGPTAIMLFPRIAEIIYQTWQGEVQRRVAAGADAEAADGAVRAEMGPTFLGHRLCSAGVASSPTAPEVQDFLRQCFGLALIDGYSSTEAGTGAITVDGWVQRGLVIDYKLLDVPELSYYSTDRPYPRGELLLKSRLAIKGYYKRPEATAEILDAEGWLHTGDIVEEREPDRVVWIGRRNNVIKLSQAEYVALGPLEATYLAQSALVRQIFIHGNSYRSFLLAVVVPDQEIAASRLGRAAAPDELRAMVLAELQEVARAAGLKSFEVPRDVLIELEPFSHENGLLSSVRKPLHPKLKERYGDALEAIYQDMDRQQQQELALLRADDGGLSTTAAGRRRAQSQSRACRFRSRQRRMLFGTSAGIRWARFRSRCCWRISSVSRCRSASCSILRGAPPASRAISTTRRPAPDRRRCSRTSLRFMARMRRCCAPPISRSMPFSTPARWKQPPAPPRRRNGRARCCLPARPGFSAGSSALNGWSGWPAAAAS